MPDYKDMPVNRLVVQEGSGVPGLRGVLLERNAAAGLGLKVGESLAIEMEDGNFYNLKVEGIVHDMAIQPYAISGDVQGYVTMPTLQWMGERPYYNQLHVLVAENKNDRDHVLAIGGLVRDRIIEPGGYSVGAMQVRGDPNPGEFWAKKQVSGVLLVLQVMSVLAIVLSGGLVINTISAVLIQQTRQIGIMRSVGATRRQIVQMYLAYVLVLSVDRAGRGVATGHARGAGATGSGERFPEFQRCVQSTCRHRSC